MIYIIGELRPLVSYPLLGQGNTLQPGGHMTLKSTNLGTSQNVNSSSHKAVAYWGEPQCILRLVHCNAQLSPVNRVPQGDTWPLIGATMPGGCYLCDADIKLSLNMTCGLGFLYRTHLPVGTMRAFSDLMKCCVLTTRPSLDSTSYINVPLYPLY